MQHLTSLCLYLSICKTAELMWTTCFLHRSVVRINNIRLILSAFWRAQWIWNKRSCMDVKYVSLIRRPWGCPYIFREHQLFCLLFEMVPKREDKTWLKDMIETTLLVTVHSTSVQGGGDYGGSDCWSPLSLVCYLVLNGLKGQVRPQMSLLNAELTPALAEWLRGCLLPLSLLCIYGNPALPPPLFKSSQTVPANLSKKCSGGNRAMVINFAPWLEGEKLFIM
jgi:hypothetical protein